VTSGDEVAVITGAASGIGRATAVRQAATQRRLVVVDRDGDGLERAAAEIESRGGRCAQVVVDLAAGEDAAATVLERVGASPVGLLINGAGIGFAATAEDTSTERWERTLAVNLSATFYMCRAFLPRMLGAGRGVIVNIASAGALVGLRNRAAYCASKAGVVGLTRAIAADHAGDGIRINAVCPGTVDSPWIDRILADDPDPVATRKRMEQRQLDGRMGTPEEVAEWIAFIAADTGRFMNGACLTIDGGLTAV
jgi:NAD(P)-dependent dehydrogenase (short-subunit alcohol dehydrogenase family)